MSMKQYELLVVHRLTGEVHKNLTKMYNDYLLFEDVEGMNLPSQYKVELRK